MEQLQKKINLSQAAKDLITLHKTLQIIISENYELKSNVYTKRKNIEEKLKKDIDDNKYVFTDLCNYLQCNNDEVTYKLNQFINESTVGVDIKTFLERASSTLEKIVTNKEDDSDVIFACRLYISGIFGIIAGELSPEEMKEKKIITMRIRGVTVSTDEKNEENPTYIKGIKKMIV